MSDETTSEQSDVETKTEPKAKPEAKAEVIDMTFVKDLRKENMSHRLARYELQEKLDAAEKDFTKRLEDTKSQAREEAKKEAQLDIAMARFEGLALKDGLSDPDVLALFDKSKFVFDDKGKITNAAELLAEFKAAKPHFFTSQATSSTAKAPKAADATAKSVKDMTPAEYEAAKKAKGIR